MAAVVLRHPLWFIANFRRAYTKTRNKTIDLVDASVFSFGFRTNRTPSISIFFTLIDGRFDLFYCILHVYKDNC